ncbi:MAG: c-type cytochrome [Elusimicrobia bacterium]|nr:c-type cytochrome [Elusimicrobiota bacterium]
MKPFLLILVLIAAGCKQAPPTGPGAGKAYFAMAGCVNCHKVGDEGSAVGPDLTFVGFRHSPEWLELFIKDPQAWKKDTLMPNKRMTEEALKALVAYLKELKGQDWPKGGRPWDAPSLIKDPVARGRVIFNRAGCAGCHGADGLGGYPNNNVKGGLIPPVNKAADGFTKAELIAKIKKGVPRSQKADEKGPAPMIRMPAWGETLDDAELDAVASYLLSLRPAGAEKPEF